MTIDPRSPCLVGTARRTWRPGDLGGSVCFPGRQAVIATADTTAELVGEFVADRFSSPRIRPARLDLEGPPVVETEPDRDQVDASKRGQS